MIEYTVKVYPNGNKFWCFNGKLHREDGPAVEHANGGYKAWYLNSKLHREDGPAVEYSDGSKLWWLNGKRHTKQEWEAEVAKLKNTCDGKVIEVDGKQYQLKEL